MGERMVDWEHRAVKRRGVRFAPPGIRWREAVRRRGDCGRRMVRSRRAHDAQPWGAAATAWGARCAAVGRTLRSRGVREAQFRGASL